MITSLLVIMFIVGLWSTWYVASLGGLGTPVGVMATLFVVTPTIIAMHSAVW